MNKLPLLEAFLYSNHNITDVKPYVTEHPKEFRYFTGYAANGQKVFIKLDPSLGQLAGREAYMLQLINSYKWGVAPGLLGFDSKGDFPFVATEFIHGLTLEQFLQRKRLVEAQKRVLLLRMASTLKKLHSIKVVHRDVRPGNIIVQIDKKRRIQKLLLIDFGNAVKLDNLMLELSYLKHRVHIMRKLGGRFKLKPLTWDDAYSFSIIAKLVEPNCHIKHPDIWSSIQSSIGKITYTYKN